MSDDSGFTAKYDSGTCTGCKQPIVIGQQIVSDGGGGTEGVGPYRSSQIWRYRHVACNEGAHR